MHQQQNLTPDQVAADKRLTDAGFTVSRVPGTSTVYLSNTERRRLTFQMSQQAARVEARRVQQHGN